MPHGSPDRMPPTHGGEDTAPNDGFVGRLVLFATTHFGWAWRLLEGVEPIRRRLNRALVNRAILNMPPRPNPLSTMAPYTSWASLTDRTYSARHLPPAEEEDGDLPPVRDVAALFNRGDDVRLCPKSTVLFPYFAEWFVDGFLRSERVRHDPLTNEVIEPRPGRNESSHEIDLMQIYGLDPMLTSQLRAHEDGLLQYQTINGEDYPPYLYEGENKKFDKVTLVRDDKIEDHQRRQLFALGSDTGNLQLGFVMMNVLFLREHNRIARELGREYGWDDERTFQTTRNILTAILIKIVVEDYINHITPLHFRLVADPMAFRTATWYRTNWMAVEFNLLYRWHSLVPSSFRIAGSDVAVEETLFNTDTLVEHGLGACFEDASNQRAGRVGLFNSPPEVWDAEVASVTQARAVGLRPYNAYRRLGRLSPVTSFDRVSSRREVRDALRDLYGDVDRVEFYPGLFAEDVRNSVLPPLVARMVAADAFSQAFTNPLLSSRIYNPTTFSPLGWELIRTTRSLSDLLHRNVPEGSRRHFVSLTRHGWKGG